MPKLTRIGGLPTRDRVIFNGPVRPNLDNVNELRPAPPDFVPGELEVKLKPGVIGGNPIIEVGFLDLLQTLKRRFGLIRIEPLQPVRVTILPRDAKELGRRFFSAGVTYIQKLVNVIQLFVPSLAAIPAELMNRDEELEALRSLQFTFDPEADLSAVVDVIRAYSGIEAVTRIPFVQPPFVNEKDRARLAEDFPPPSPDGPPAFPTGLNGFWGKRFIEVPLQENEFVSDVYPSLWETEEYQLNNIAVLDSGCQASHPALAGQVEGDPGSLTDGYGHGTAVCGILAGRAVPASDVDGLDAAVVPDVSNGLLPNATIWVANIMRELKVLGRSEYVLHRKSYYAALSRVLTMRDRIRVLNLSIGSVTYDPIEADYMQKLEDAGIVVVASAGNTPENATQQLPVMYPALYPTVISVGACALKNPLDQWMRSNYDFPNNVSDSITSAREYSVDVVAPGQYIVTTIPTGKSGMRYRFSSWLDGTSMAAPYVTAAVGVLCEIHRRRGEDVSPAEIRKELFDLCAFPNNGVFRGMLNCGQIRL
jgi:major intracellular serine protease